MVSGKGDAPSCVFMNKFMLHLCMTPCKEVLQEHLQPWIEGSTMEGAFMSTKACHGSWPNHPRSKQKLCMAFVAPILQVLIMYQHQFFHKQYSIVSICTMGLGILLHIMPFLF